MNASVSVLFCAANSIYKTLDVDCWDEQRNALNWPGGNPIIAHPPCRLFCALRHFSTANPNEKNLAYWAVKQVRTWGGILEHPARSRLWEECALPFKGRDAWGFTFCIDQFWWGHRAFKPTWLYICGTDALPLVPFVMGMAPALQSNSRKANRFGRKLLSRPARSATPVAFAKWLIETASKCHRPL